jgi:hypothetical protein
MPWSSEHMQGEALGGTAWGTRTALKLSTINLSR